MYALSEHGSRHCGLRILVTPTHLRGDLVDYLRRCGCTASIAGKNGVEASPGGVASAAQWRRQLDAYVRVWRMLHPTVGAELVGRAPVESVASNGSAGGRESGAR